MTEFGRVRPQPNRAALIGIAVGLLLAPITVLPASAGDVQPLLASGPGTECCIQGNTVEPPGK
ncbi:hypothetical protein [Pseudonocardia sp. TRM90224]|uniref:hypothetical protein n=1 Tax=Pseudonocardia sp. TRM90224 TaxID=2812678 RepID=UPI001E61B222|nr:hypothetical protein [Pseudonocardia sp. TRM90224]